MISSQLWSPSEKSGRRGTEGIELEVEAMEVVYVTIHLL